jgi:hypothetical protein
MIYTGESAKLLAMICEGPICKLGDFLDTVANIRRTWQVKNAKELWFRGEKEDYGVTALRPGLYRPFLHALKSSLDLIDIEDDLFAHFRHCSTELERAELSGEAADDSWVEYFQMQHHLAPTRLLDWSDGALVALHFAIRSDGAHVNCDGKGPNPRVYVIDPYWLMDCIQIKTNNHDAAKKAWIEYCRKYPTQQNDEADWDQCYLPDEDGHDELPVPEYPLVLEFDHFSRRISAQRSRFIVMGTAPDFFNQLMNVSDAKIATIQIAHDAVPKMRVDLRDAGVTESSIYPDLNGLATEVKQLWNERLQEPS